MNGLLDAVGITKSFSGIRALDDVTLRVDEGERVGLIGPNGAGKTTLFNCILGNLRPDAGSVSPMGSTWAPCRCTDGPAWAWGAHSRGSNCSATRPLPSTC